jgi:glycosyltransferase involved in cell wall biosynthesis
MPDPLLSIIIPTRNAGKTLQRALDSILSQQFTDWEVLIMDSVSGDDTLVIGEKNLQQDSRIKLISEPDKGIYDAMNKGIRLAKGAWIYFLGGDDRLYDARVLQNIFSGNPDLYPDGVSPDLIYGDVVSASFKGRYDGEFTTTKLLSRNISHQAIFYKRTLFEFVGSYNLRFKAHADWDLNIRSFGNSLIRTRFLDVVVAEFGANGVSSRHDVPFLREVLFPEKLAMLQGMDIRRLRSIRVYDEWWRLIRNAAFRRPEELDEYTRGQSIPASIRSMIRWQRMVSLRLLRKGGFSKCLMFACYLKNLLTGSIF